VCTSEEELKSFTAFHKPFVFLISLLASLVGLHFQVLGISPLKRHFTIILLLIMATVVYSNAYMRINLQPQNREYLPIFRCICLISGIIACELLLAMIISLFWLFIINLCTILIVEILHLWYQQIYKYLYRTASVVYNAVRGLFQQIFQSIHLTASHVVSLTRRSTERQDVDQTAGNV